MTDRNLSRMDCSRWLSWVMATAIGSAAGFGALTFILPVVRSVADVDGDKLVGFLVAPLLGFFIGTLQWIVLRRRLPQAGWWIAATVAGYIMVLIFSTLATTVRLAEYPGMDGGIPLMGLLGLALGIPQYLLLRKHMANAEWWLLASAIGMLAFQLGGIIPAHNPIELVRLGLCVGAISGAISGTAWLWLNRSQRPIGLGYS